MSDFIEELENNLKFSKKSNMNSNLMFFTKGSAGRNTDKLARILTAFDMIIEILGWQDKPLAKFSNIITQYQASLDGKYHNDFKDVLIAEEIEKRREQRKGISIMQQ